MSRSISADEEVPFEEPGEPIRDVRSPSILPNRRKSAWQVLLEAADKDGKHDAVDLRRSSVPAAVTLADSRSEGQSITLLGIGLLMLYCAASVGEQQLLKNVFSDEFYAPFFVLYCNNVLRLIAFPVYVILVKLQSVCKDSEKPIAEIIRECSIFRSRDPWLIFFIRSIGILGSVIVLAVTSNIMSLAYATASECAAVQTTQVVMVYVVAVTLLGQRPYLVKVLAVVVSLTGVALIGYSKGFHSSSITGIGLSLMSTVLFVFNILYFKQVYKSLTFGQCCCFMSTTALFTVVFFWTIPLWMKLANGEFWEWNNVPWDWMMAGCASSLIAAKSVNYGLIIANPLLMSFGSLLRIPCNIVIDYFLRHVRFTQLEIIGSVLIALGFVFTVIPDRFISLDLKKLRKRRRRPSGL